VWPLGKVIDDGEQKQWLIWGAMVSGRAPVGTAGSGVAVGEGVAVHGQEIEQLLIKF